MHSRPVLFNAIACHSTAPVLSPRTPSDVCLAWSAVATLRQRTETGLTELDIQALGLSPESDPSVQGAKGSPLRSRSTGTARD